MKANRPNPVEDRVEYGAPRPTPEMIAERDQRYSCPFDIRFDLLGEPEPGRSALDRKLAGLPA